MSEGEGRFLETSVLTTAFWVCPPRHQNCRICGRSLVFKMEADSVGVDRDERGNDDCVRDRCGCKRENAEAFPWVPLWRPRSTPNWLSPIHPRSDTNTLLLRLLLQENSTVFSRTDRIIIMEVFASPYFIRIMNAMSARTVVGRIGAHRRRSRATIMVDPM